jgi:cardiolipin synthase
MRNGLFWGQPIWDARSLRLNFEFNVECYSVEFGAELAQMVRARLSESRLLRSKK